MLQLKHIDLTRLGTDNGAADFGRVWGGFWEAEILDFRTFFDIFSLQNLECNLEGQKIEKKAPKNDFP